MLQSQQHIKIGAKKDSKGKADMKLGIGKKLGSCMLIKESGEECWSSGVLLVRLSRQNQPTAMGVTLGCCKCVVTTHCELCHTNL